jgi:hypothetical protein
LEARNANATVDEIKQKLLDTFNRFNTFYNDGDFNTTKYSKLYNSIGNYTTVLIDYNRLINLYLMSTGNITTRQQIYRTLMEMRDLYEKLAQLSLGVLDNYGQIPDPTLRETAIRKYFVKVLLLHSLFNLISKQFNQNYYFIIPENAILTNIEFLPNRVKDVIAEFNLKVELYGVAPNITNTPPPAGAAPPSAPQPPSILTTSTRRWTGRGPGGGGPGPGQGHREEED